MRDEANVSAVEAPVGQVPCAKGSSAPVALTA
jgi:hypothetical protein